MARSTTEVAVVGAGICGLSAAYALRRRGADFRLFEAGVPGSGQSAGRTRVFRHGHEDERLVGLAVRARGEWERLEDELGVRLLGRQGVLIRGPQVGAREAAFDAAGVRSRRVGSEAQAEALPILREPGVAAGGAGGPPDDDALLDEGGGFTDVRAVVDGLAEAVSDRLVIAQVFDVAQAGDGVEVRTSEGIWSAGRAIVCAGADTPGLGRPLGIDVPLATELHTRAAFTVREPGAQLACLQDRSETHGEVVYASPMPDGLQYAIGLGAAHEPPVEEALARLSRYASAAFPGLDPEPAAVRLCRTSVLPWGADALAVWRTGSVDLLAGANLFKFGPLLGELLANDGAAELAPEHRLGRDQPVAAPA